jgi:hypothetical protein
MSSKWIDVSKASRGLAAFALFAGLALVAGCGAADPDAAGEDVSSAASAVVTPPTITALNVTGSPPEGGKTVLIVGTGFQDGATVTYDGIPALSVTTDPSSGGLVTITPPHPEGFVDVVVTNPDGGSATRTGFHYGPPPVITSFSPTSVRKGDTITITGTDFAAALGVQVGIGPAFPQVLSKSSTQIVVVAPKLNAGNYQVFVTNFDSQYSVGPGYLNYPAH